MLFKKFAVAAAIATTLAFVGCSKKEEAADAVQLHRHRQMQERRIRQGRLLLLRGTTEPRKGRDHADRGSKEPAV